MPAQLPDSLTPLAAQYEYKCVPLPLAFHTDKGRDSFQKALRDYEHLLNEAAAGGWQLVQTDTIFIHQQSGRIGKLMGRRDELEKQKVLIFQRLRPNMPLPQQDASQAD